jgi:hypothetical protein
MLDWSNRSQSDEDYPMNTSISKAQVKVWLVLGALDAIGAAGSLWHDYLPWAWLAQGYLPKDPKTGVTAPRPDRWTPNKNPWVHDHATGEWRRWNSNTGQWENKGKERSWDKEPTKDSGLPPRLGATHKD